MGRWVLFALVQIIVIFGPSKPLPVTVFPAASCTTTDVQAAHDNAAVKNGWTIQLPTCTQDWVNCSTQCVNFTKAITLRGQPCTLDGNGRPTACPTIIRDAPTANQSYRLMSFTLVSNQTSRLTNIEFDNSTRTVETSDKAVEFKAGSIAVSTSSARMIADHLFFNELKQQAIYTFGVYGVIYRNNFQFIGNSRPVTVWGLPAAVTDYGDTWWSLNTNFGTEQFLFVEDNNISYNSAGFERGAMDAFGGARYVARFNTNLNSNYQGHGTESSGRARSTRAMEIYRNSQTANFGGAQTAVNNRGGTMLFWDNTLTGYGAANFQLNCDRNTYSSGGWTVNIPASGLTLGTPWGHADGRSEWDVNDAGVPNATGTIDSYTSATRTINVAGSPYSADQYNGYTFRRVPGATQPSVVTSITTGNPTIINTSAAHGFVTGQTVLFNGLTITSSPTFSVTTQYPITEVDADSFSIAVNSSAASDQAGFVYNGAASQIDDTTTGTLLLHVPTNGTMTFVAGESFEINKITHGLDCPGRGSTTSSFFMGGLGPPLSFPSGNDQTLDPIYEWGNRTDGSFLTASGQVGAGYFIIRQNEHFYMESDGGTGEGTSLPAMCSVGQGYFKTDEGTWNQVDANQGRFYTCTAPNTWTLTYTPYTYPHPLRAIP